MSALHKIIYVSIAAIFFVVGLACAEKAPVSPSPILEMGDNVFVIENATQVVAAKLKVIAAAEAHANALKDETRISGYPVIDNAVVLPENIANRVKRILVKEAHYAVPRIRCANQEFYGLRFMHNKNKVEIALGKPCNQVIWAYPKKNTTELWGGVIESELVTEIISIIDTQRKSLDQ